MLRIVFCSIPDDPLAFSNDYSYGVLVFLGFVKFIRNETSFSGLPT